MPNLDEYVLQDMPVEVTMSDFDWARAIGYLDGLATASKDTGMLALVERMRAALEVGLSTPITVYRVETSTHEAPCPGCWSAAQSAIGVCNSEGVDRHSSVFYDDASVEHVVRVYRYEPEEVTP